MMYSNTLLNNSCCHQSDLSFLGAAQFFLKTTRLVLLRINLFKCSLQFPSCWLLPPEILNTIYSRCSPIFPFLSFFFKSFYCLNSFTSIILSINCSLTLFIHGISGALSSFFHMSPQNLINFSISGIWPICFVPPFTFLKKFFWSLSKLALSFIGPSLSMNF